MQLFNNKRYTLHPISLSLSHFLSLCLHKRRSFSTARILLEFCLIVSNSIVTNQVLFILSSSQFKPMHFPTYTTYLLVSHKHYLFISHPHIVSLSDLYLLMSHPRSISHTHNLFASISLVLSLTRTSLSLFYGHKVFKMTRPNNCDKRKKVHCVSSLLHLQCLF